MIHFKIVFSNASYFLILPKIVKKILENCMINQNDMLPAGILFVLYLVIICLHNLSLI